MTSVRSFVSTNVTERKEKKTVVFQIVVEYYSQRFDSTAVDVAG